MLALFYGFNIFSLRTLWFLKSFLLFLALSVSFSCLSFLCFWSMLSCYYVDIHFYLTVMFQRMYWKFHVCVWGLASRVVYFLQWRILQSSACMYEPGWQHSGTVWERTLGRGSLFSGFPLIIPSHVQFGISPYTLVILADQNL